MPKSIWKYPLETDDKQTLSLPKGAEILTVQIQGETLCLWAFVNPNNEKEEISLRIIGTGHPIEDSFQGKYLGTYQLMGGGLIFHVFKVT